jgi:hypothetical protein
MGRVSGLFPQLSLSSSLIHTVLMASAEGVVGIGPTRSFHGFIERSVSSHSLEDLHHV